MIPIRYREFYDVPRIFLVEFRGYLFLFESMFDEKFDDYSIDYDVFMMPQDSALDLLGSWDQLSAKALKHLGKCPIENVTFDESRRREIDAGPLEELGARIGLWQ